MGGEALHCRSRHHPGRDGDVRLQLVLSIRCDLAPSRNTRCSEAAAPVAERASANRRQRREGGSTAAFPDDWFVSLPAPLNVFPFLRGADLQSRRRSHVTE
jgi:hypothetical protein